jgi:isoleucyl-tRNA synthetase
MVLHGSDRLKAAWESFAPLAAGETLARDVIWGPAEGQVPLEAGDEQWLVKIEKV